MDKINTTILIPVHEYNENVKVLLGDALESVKKQEKQPEAIALVAPKQLEGQLKSDHGVDVIINDGETDFCSQINKAVEVIKTEYFTILEFDDKLTANSLTHLSQYLACGEYSKSDIILPLVSILKDGREIMFVNDAAWAQGFTSKLGYLDLKSITDNDSFIISGATLKVESFISSGGFKKDIKLFFTKELLMRSLHMGQIVSVLPKITTVHTIGREGSLFENYKTQGLGSEEMAYYEKAIKKGEYKHKESKLKPYSSVNEG